jgi:hypothetical protein
VQEASHKQYTSIFVKSCDEDLGNQDQNDSDKVENKREQFQKVEILHLFNRQNNCWALVKINGRWFWLTLIKGQLDYMSKCVMLMFLWNISPEIGTALIKLSTKYNKVTKEDIKKAIRVAEYIYGCKDTH